MTNQRIVTVVLALVATVSMAAGASAQGDTITLLWPAPLDTSVVLLDQGDDPLVIRQGLLGINTDILRSVVLQRAAVEISLFDDVKHQAVIDSSVSTERGWRISGSLQDEAYGSVVLALSGDAAVSGTVRTTSGTYQIRTLPDNVYVVTQVDPDAFLPEAQPLEHQQDSRGIADPQYRGEEPVGLTAQQEDGTGGVPDDPDPDPPSRAGGSATIDILLLYTRAARDLAGGPLAVQSLLNLFVEETNRGFAGSDVLAQLRIAGMSEVDFQKTNPEADLHSLAENGDGILDDVRDLREQSSADVVHLVVDGFWAVNGRGICGIAQGLLDPRSPDDSIAFSMSGSGMQCNLSFAHEMGHLMGLSHDHYAVNANGGRPRGAFHYSYGYVNRSESWRTIMAYPEACSPNRCPRLPLYSNPRRNHLVTGSPLGQLNSADASQSLNQTRTIVASFR